MIFNPEDKNKIPEDQTGIEYLLLNGALEICGLDNKTGEFLYKFTPKVEKIMPDLYQEHLKDVNTKLMALWEKGFVDIDLMSDNPIVKLNSKSFDFQELSKLSKEDQWSIEEIKRVIKRKEV